jgi:hypothetical protein
MRYQKRCVVIRKQLALSEVVDYYVDIGTVKPLILPLPRESPLLACHLLRTSGHSCLLFTSILQASAFI